MTPLQASEPLLQYICRLNRWARRGGSFDVSVVRSQINELFDKIEQDVADVPGLAEHFEYGRGQLGLVLMFFVDFMIRESKLPFAAEWSDLAIERHDEPAGDERFFDLLEQALADRSDAAAPRLAVYYTCIGLGFTGRHSGQAEYLRKKMLEIHTRIRAIMDVDRTARICPEAYAHTNTSDLVHRPSTRLFGILLVTFSLIVALVVANVYLYRSTSATLDQALNRIVKADRGATDVTPSQGSSAVGSDSPPKPKPAETPTDPTPGTEAATPTKTETGTETEVEPKAEPEAEPVAEPKAEPVAEPKAEPVAEPAAEPVVEPDSAGAADDPQAAE